MAGSLHRNSMKFMLGFVTIWTWISQLESSGLSLPDSVQVIQSESFQKSVESIALLPLWSQKVVLKDVGEEYVKHNATECNVFRGSETCLVAPDYSDYIKSCDSKNRPVDCAFKAFLTKSSFEGLSLQQYVGAEGLMDCADCQDNFKKFWCAVNTPPCGTIDKVLDEILPVISSITSEKSSATISLQQALPRIIQAASLGFPCKKMCKDVMDSCGCSQQPTFGEVMDAIQAGGNLNATITMGLSTKELFHLIWDKHVCDLFSEESFPGFSGLCVSSYQASRCNWCNVVQGSNSHHKKFVEQGVLQLSKMIFSLLQGGLQEVLLAVDHKKQVNSHIVQATSPSIHRKSTGHAGAVLLVVVFVAFIIFSFMATIKLSRNRPIPSQYVDLSGMGYTPPML